MLPPSPPARRALAVAALLLLPVGLGLLLQAPSAHAAVVSAAPVLKTYYFHRDAALPDTDRHGWLNTSGPTDVTLPRPFDYDGDNNAGITLDNTVSGTPATRRYNFSSAPVYARDFHILGNLTAQLYFAADKNQGTPSISIAVSLLDLPPAGGPPALISTAVVTTFISKSTGAGPTYGFSPVSFGFPGINYTLLQGHQLGVRVDRTDAANYKLYLAFDATALPAALVFATDTTLSLVDAATMDVASRRRSLFVDTEIILFMIRVGHAMGSGEIAGASVEIIDNTTGLLFEPSVAMLFSAIDVTIPSFWKEFVLNHAPLPVGSYIARINVTDPSGATLCVELPLEIQSGIPVDHFAVLGTPALVQVGVSFNVTVEARDVSDAPLAGWAGDIVLSAWDAANTSRPAAGTLSNTAIHVDPGQGGRGWAIGGTNYTGPVAPIVIRAELATGPGPNGTSPPIQLLPGPLTAITIDPGANQTLAAGTRLTFVARGWDAYGNANSSIGPVWSLTGAIGTLSATGEFTSQRTGNGEITLTDALRPALRDVVGITVVPGPVVTISLSPARTLTVEAGAVIGITATGRDAYGNVNGTWIPEWTIGAVTEDPERPLGGKVTVTIGSRYVADLIFTGVGLAELTVRDPATNRSAGLAIVIVPGPINSVVLEVGGDLNLTTAETRILVASAFDRFGNRNETWIPSWDILVGEGSFDSTENPREELFVPGQSGRVVVKAYAGGSQATVTLIVDPTGLAAAVESPVFWSTGSLLALALLGTVVSVWRLRPTFIDEVLLISSSGLLLKRRTRQAQLRATQDDDVLAGMLTTVQEFITDSFEAGGGAVDEIKFRRSRIILRRLEHVILAAIVSRGDAGKVRSQVEAAAKDIEERFGTTLEGWNGELEQLDPLDEVVDQLISGRYTTD